MMWCGEWRAANSPQRIEKVYLYNKHLYMPMRSPRVENRLDGFEFTGLG